MSMEEYYIYKTLVIEYISKSNRVCKITTDVKRKKRYNNTPDFEEIPENKIIFESKNWIHTSYQKKYEPKLREIYDIDVIIKIYKQKSICF